MSTNERFARAKLALKAIEVRLRFILILAATGLVIGKWESLKNHWERWTRRAPPPVVAGAGTEFYCPMHPTVVRASLEPNGEVPRCPICGMPLSERKKGAAAPLPPGVTGRVQISPERIQLAGIQTVTVAPRALVREISTVGDVEYDEGRLSRIVTRAGGYIEKLYVNETFVSVREGEPLAEVYSPELYTAAQELLVAARGGPELAEGAREKLRLLGVSEPEIDEIAASKKPSSRLVIRSLQTGHVIHRAVVRGAHVNPGDTLFEVADLSRVWIEAFVFEKDIPFLKEGQPIEASVEAFPGRVFSGTVSLVHPHLQAETRTNQVRFVLENPHHDLRPGMYATVSIKRNVAETFASIAVTASEVLAVPENAVIDTGTKKIVYVERSPGVFEGVLVELGPRAGGFYPVAKGLAAGDRVAAAGAFLIDAETRLDPAAAGTYMGATGGPHADKGDAAAIALQGTCPISGNRLGSMGDPVKIVLEGETIFLCCSGCTEEAEKDPAKTLAKARALRGGK